MPFYSFFLTRSNPILSNEGGGQAQRRRLDTEDKLRGCTLWMRAEVPAIRWVSGGADREGECREGTEDVGVGRDHEWAIGRGRAR